MFIINGVIDCTIRLFYPVLDISHRNTIRHFNSLCSVVSNNYMAFCFPTSCLKVFIGVGALVTMLLAVSMLGRNSMLTQSPSTPTYRRIKSSTRATSISPMGHSSGSMLQPSSSLSWASLDSTVTPHSLRLHKEEQDASGAILHRNIPLCHRLPVGNHSLLCGTQNYLRRDLLSLKDKLDPGSGQSERRGAGYVLPGGLSLQLHQ